MELIKVVSSNIDSIGYKNQTLTIKFKYGAIYKYSNVPEKIFTELYNSESKGKYFNQNIKMKFNFTKI